MCRINASEDEVYKYFLKVLKERFHRRLGYECEEIELLNPELIPPGVDHKFMDGYYKVDGISKHNLEFQSTPVYYPKMIDMLKYFIDSESDEFTEFSTCVLATYNPKWGISGIEFGNITFKPKFFFTKELNASETIKTVTNKNKNQISLTDNEAIDLLLAPDMNHNYDIKELLEITSELLVNATIPNVEFHKSLMDCQKKSLQRFLTIKQRKEIEKMIKLNAKDYGFEPNVTGFEESNNLAYFDGVREGKIEGFDEGFDDANLKAAQNLIDLGSDDDFIVKVTGLDLNIVQELRK